MLKRLKTLCFSGIILFFCASISPAWAVRATLMSAKLTLDEPGESPGLFLSIAYEFELPEPLKEALHRGIPLYFRYDFFLRKERWYWFNKEKATKSHYLRFSFDPLTQRYRVSSNGLHQTFDTFEEALPFIKKLYRWRVAPPITLHDNYVAKVSFQLDTSKLPKPMQVTSGDDEEWRVRSERNIIQIPSAFTESK